MKIISTDEDYIPADIKQAFSKDLLDDIEIILEESEILDEF
jgi:hypothetical protein